MELRRRVWRRGGACGRVDDGGDATRTRITSPARGTVREAITCGKLKLDTRCLIKKQRGTKKNERVKWNQTDEADVYIQSASGSLALIPFPSFPLLVGPLLLARLSCRDVHAAFPACPSSSSSPRRSTPCRLAPSLTPPTTSCLPHVVGDTTLVHSRLDSHRTQEQRRRTAHRATRTHRAADTARTSRHTPPLTTHRTIRTRHVIDEPDAAGRCGRTDHLVE